MLARLIALLYGAVGLGMILNRAHYEKLYRALIESPALIYISGIIALLFGFLIVSIHNIWDVQWTLFITIFGWLALIKGIVILAAPKLLIITAQFFLGKRHFMVWEGVFALALGLVMAYFGFCPAAL